MKIKFSHKYTKMPEIPSPSFLLDVIYININERSKHFLDYDTEIVGGGHYELASNPGNYLLLLLLTTQGRLWTTIRRYTPKKRAYYDSHIGEWFEVVIE